MKQHKVYSSKFNLYLYWKGGPKLDKFPNRNIYKILIAFVLIIALLATSTLVIYNDSSKVFSVVAVDSTGEKKFIKWVEFNACYEAMEKALTLDVKSHNKEIQLNWVELLAYLGARYGGDFKKYKSKDMDELVAKLNKGQTIQQLTENMKYYNYYYEAYDAILGNFVGEYEIQVKDQDNNGDLKWKENTVLKFFHPLPGVIVSVIMTISEPAAALAMPESIWEMISWGPLELPLWLWNRALWKLWAGTCTEAGGLVSEALTRRDIIITLI